MKKVLRDPLAHFLLAGVALFVLFELVASDEATYVTGATFNVDGGITAAYVTPE